MQQFDQQTVRQQARGAFLLFAFFCLLPFSASLCAQTTKSARDREGTRAILIENLFSKLYPGSSVQWEPTFALIGPDGVKQRVSLPGITQTLVQGGWLGVAGLESLDAKATASTALAAFQPPPVGTAPAELVAFRTDMNFNIQDIRRGIIDSSSSLGEILYVAVQNFPNGSTWPLLDVTYRTNFGTGDWFGRVTWHAQVDADTLAVIGKIPIAIYKRTRSSAAPEEELISLKRLDPSTIEVRGVSSEKTISLPCVDPCQIDARALLNQW